MPRIGWLFLALATGTGGTVVAIPRPPLSQVVRAAIESAPADDPFPIRRVRGTDARLPDLLKELEPGPTVRLPRAAFESRVRAAGRLVDYAKYGARLVDAVYTAELDGGDLVGVAELGVLNAHGVTGFIPLDPLRIAVRDSKWSDGRTAALAWQNGAPAAWVDRGGRSVLRLNWSLAGTTEPGERRFELRVPHCPVSTLELELPADRVPTGAADVLLTGPSEIPGKPGRRVWRLRFGGRAKAEFAVRAAGAAGGFVQTKLTAKYDFQPGQMAASFEYDLRPAYGSAAEWGFAVDGGLRVVDVMTNNRAGWSIDPPVVPGGPRRIRVALRQPAPGGKVLITAVAPFPDRGPDSPLPAVRPLNAVLDDERLELRFAAGLKIESWASGDYRLTEATAPATGAADQARALTLVGTLLPAGADESFRRMPSVRVGPPDAEFTTFERLEWHLSPARSVLAVRVMARVRRGPLFHITVRPPPGYAFERGESESDEFVSYIGPVTGGQQVVEFARPLATGQVAELQLKYRAAAKPDDARPFPSFAVTGAAEREGWLGITAEPSWAVSVSPGVGANSGGLWGWLTTDVRSDADVYLFRGREPDGAATLHPTRRPAVADASVRIDSAGGTWVATTRFAVATAVASSTAAVFVPGPRDARSWKWADGANVVVDAVAVPHDVFELAPVFPPSDLLAGVAGNLARAGADGTVWLLRFARPVTGIALETSAPGSGTFASVPVPRVLGANQTTRVEMVTGLRDRAEVDSTGDYVRPRPLPPADGPVRTGVSDAYLVTAVRGPGEAAVAFGGTVRGGRGEPVRVILPPGAEVRGVCVAGRWLSPAVCADRDPDGALRVPVPLGGAVRFEIRYRLPVDAGWPTRRVNSPVPVVAGGTPAVSRWWGFTPGVLPGWPTRPWDAVADEPPLLGGPLSSGEPFTTVARSDGEQVRVGEARTADALAGGGAAALLALGLVAARRRRARGAVALAGAVVASLLAVELGPPWWARVAWPPLCAATVALAVVLVGIAVRSRKPVSALAAVLLFLVPALAATGQPVPPTTVLIVPTDGGEEVVAARATLERIDALAKPQLPGPVVTAATYDVRADDSGARITAKFVVYAFRSESVLSLPLTDARLEAATVDGAPAFPASPVPNTYTLAVGGPGRHEIELRFAATVTSAGAERDLRFGVPEVPEAKLVASLPGAARQPSAVGRVGRQSVTAGGERTTLGADLGTAKSVHLRWREGTGGGAAAVKVREACVWNVTETGADLTAAYLVRVEQGAVAGLRYEIPAELDVLRVAARSFDAPSGAVPLRDWALAAEKGGFRPLRVDFQAPAFGRLLVVLECAPRKPLTRQPVLRFPRVSFGAIAGETDAVYGLRVSRVQVESVGLVGLIDFPADALKDFTVVPDLRLDPLNSVRVFKPGAGATELRPTLRVGEPPAVRTATAWHVGPGRADGVGTVTWQAKDTQPLIEFALPGAKVTEVRGPDVASWSQFGGRVQVWLRGGGREGAVEWTGTSAPTEGTFDPVHPVVAHARHQSDDVRVRTVTGWAVKADRARGWQSIPAATGELHFHTDLPVPPSLRVQLIIMRP